jgi:hypothetical protein
MLRTFLLVMLALGVGHFSHLSFRLLLMIPEPAEASSLECFAWLVVLVFFVGSTVANAVLFIRLFLNES